MSFTVPTAPGPPTDPYGVDLAFDASGDLIVTASGALAGVTGVYNCAQAVFVRFKTALGDVPLHPQDGSQVIQTIGSKLNVSGIVQQANADLQQMLSEDQRFASAVVAQVTRPAAPNYPESIALGVTATLAGGESLTLDNVSDPSPSDVSLPQLVDPSVDPTLTYDPMTEQEYFADTPEFDTLNDLNQAEAIANDTPGVSILGTSP